MKAGYPSHAREGPCWVVAPILDSGEGGRSLYSRWVHAEEQVKKYGAVVKNPDRGHPMKSHYLRIANESLEVMRKFLLEFGLTPSSRSRIHALEPSREDDEFERFLSGG